MELDEAEALAHCAAEPIHIPGQVHGYGVLLAAGLDQDRGFHHASANVAEILGAEAQALFGVSWSSWFDRPLTHAIRNALRDGVRDAHRQHVGETELSGRSFEVYVHRNPQGKLLFELLPRLRTAAAPSPVDAVQATLAHLAQRESLDDLLRDAAQATRQLAGLDRVMIYRFLPDASGEVAAESVEVGLEPYLGLRYPESDIPAQARKLYLETPVRLIDDAHAPLVGLLAADPEAPPLDLSWALVRGTSPVHLQYLRNMGSRASLTLPLVVRGQLWGLVAGHHGQPIVPDPALLTAAQLLGSLLGMLIEQQLNRALDRRKSRTPEWTQILLGLEASVLEEKEIDLGSASFETLLETLPCSGVTLSLPSGHRSVGTPLTSEEVEALHARSDGGSFATDQLEATVPEVAWGARAGALVEAISSDPPVDLIWLRPAEDQIITWAGDKRTALTHTDGGTRLHPRASFDAYMETVRGQARAWTPEERRFARALADALGAALETVSQIRSQRDRLQLFIHELNHRARNVLALVRSLIRQSKRYAADIEGYGEALETRIVALATAHDLLTGSSGSGVDLEKLAATELAPYRGRNGGESGGESPRYRIEGPPVLLQSTAGPLMALVLHELATNAAKHGAFSFEAGQVALSWAKVPGGLDVRWTESGGPSTTPPTRTGLGRAILERTVPFELDGTADLEFRPEGLEARFWLPSACFSEPRTRDASTEPEGAADEPRAAEAPSGPHRGAVLVVEDSLVIAMELEEVFYDLGFDQVDLAATLMQGLARARAVDYAFAVLDINLRGELSFPIADLLVERNVPFIFASGYGDTSSLVDRFRHHPIMTKPIGRDDLARRVQAELEPE
ncbi:MAG: HWE histidine kinase domain-containing protein [Myxococcota bacterium]